MEPRKSRSFPLVDLHPQPSDLRRDVLEGLRRPSRALPCKYFYDEVGSKLFDRICELDEYYPTRTELGILSENVDAMMAALGERPLLVEFGSGSSVKTTLLLDHLPEAAGYVPVDISREHLLASCERLAERYPDLEILPVCADFTRPFDVPMPSGPVGRTVIFFPGSTIGNFTPAAAVELLRAMASDCGPHGGLIIGVDLVKDPRVLEAAYDDAEGVTAAFNLNLLRRINRELDADFDLEGFAHRARWNAELGRVEMHLESLRPQVVHVAGERFELREGETIHTESSHKYTLEGFESLALRAGFVRRGVWLDERRLFSVQLFSVGDD